MTTRVQRNLTLAAVLGMAYWLFGNLYEAVVISPNWVRDSPAQLTRLHEFFGLTSPTLYFIPITLLALVLVWVLWWRNREPDLARDHRRAGVAALALTVVNAYIVAALISTLFGADALARPERLNAAAWQWNVLNLVRMTLTGLTMYHLFNAYRKLDRRVGAPV
jgi:hypothetical protein